MADMSAGSPTASHVEHPEYVAHHYDTAAQQQDAATLGMWVFLVTEVLFFSGLFCAYAYYRMLHPDIFAIGHRFLDVTLGTVNTVVLIASSFTVAMSVWFIQHNKPRGCVICLALTLLGAFAFMGIKAVEYNDKLQKGKTWGLSFSADEYYTKKGAVVDAKGAHGAAHEKNAHGDQPAGADHADNETGIAGSAEKTEHSPAGGMALNEGRGDPTAPRGAEVPDPVAAGNVADYEPSLVEEAEVGPSAVVRTEPIELAHDAHGHTFTSAELTRRDLHIFMGVYFCLTGLHGIHVLAGIGAIIWVLVRTLRGHFSAEYHTPVHLVGLYWHLVDLVWIYLFPLLYLIH